MPRFLYYFRGQSGMNPNLMARFGVLDRFMGPGGKLIQHVIAGVNDGPQGSGTGCIVAAGNEPPDYAPERQRWFQGPQFWVGIEGMPPGPDHLIRSIGINGYVMKLEDGNHWRVPLVHRWDAEQQHHVVNLPKVMRSAPGNGKVEFVVAPEFQAADALASRIFQCFVNETTVPLETLFSDAMQLLAVNYRIGVEEASLIGLLGEASALRVLQWAIDLPAIEAQRIQLSRQGLEYTDPKIQEE